MPSVVVNRLKEFLPFKASTLRSRVKKLQLKPVEKYIKKLQDSVSKLKEKIAGITKESPNAKQLPTGNVDVIDVDNETQSKTGQITLDLETKKLIYAITSCQYRLLKSKSEYNEKSEDSSPIKLQQEVKKYLAKIAKQVWVENGMTGMNEDILYQGYLDIKELKSNDSSKKQQPPLSERRKKKINGSKLC